VTTTPRCGEALDTPPINRPPGETNARPSRCEILCHRHQHDTTVGALFLRKRDIGHEKNGRRRAPHLGSPFPTKARVSCHAKILRAGRKGSALLNPLRVRGKPLRRNWATTTGCLWATSFSPSHPSHETKQSANEKPCGLTRSNDPMPPCPLLTATSSDRDSK